MNFPPRKLGGILCLLSRMRGKLYLLVGVRTVPLGIRTLPFISIVVYIGLVHDKFCLMLYNR
jgi:hypothetical protein